MKSRFIVGILILILISINYGVQAKEYSAPESLDDTRLVKYESWDSYKILANNRDVKIDVEILSGNCVDFYVLTKSQFDDFKNPDAADFEYKDMEESISSFSWSGSRGIYYLIIDNAAITVSGAFPVDNETYQIDIVYTEINQFNTFMELISSGFEICFVTLCSSFGVCGVIILIAIITTTWMYRVPKEYREKARQLKVLSK